MPRIEEQELERLKQEVSVQRLAEAKGVKLKRHGKDLMGLCPFHDDREPSLVISPAKNLWHCLGACQAGGTSIDWVMRAENVSFRLAVELLRKDFPSLAAAAAPAARATVNAATNAPVPGAKLPPIASEDASDQEVLQRVVSFYHETLKQSPEALAYLQERGLRHPQVIEHFKLGYANRTLGYRLPLKQVKAGAQLRGQLRKLGVYRQSGHEHLSGSLVIPVLSANGEVLDLYGRKIGGDKKLREGTPLHLYLPGPHRGVFNESGLGHSDEVILCEALIDALTFWCAGYRNVTSAYGVEGFTEAHLQALQAHGIQRVYIAYDRDDAGDKAAAKLAPKLAEHGMEVLRVRFPHGLDANAYALKLQPADKALGTLLRGAEWLAGKAKTTAVPRSLEPEAIADHVAQAVTEARPEPPKPIPSLAAKPPQGEPLAEVVPGRDGEVQLQQGDRQWRVRGLDKNLSYERLRVNVLVSRGDHFHVDTLELQSARQRAAFIKQAADELGLEERVIKHDVGKLFLALERLQDERIQATLAPEPAAPSMTEVEREQAMALLQDPKLLDRILSDYARCGVVGEEVNKLVGYLGAVSRNLESPLAIVIQSTSAAGKSSLMEAVLSFVPEEERVQYSAMTGQSLFYMGEMDLSHKVLAVAEEQGAQSASYALKLLQSEGELTIASTGKDPQSGRLVTQEYRVSGPVMLFLTTTAIDIDEELLNRCIVLTVDEGRAQTQAIHREQRQSQTLEGLLAKQQRSDILRLHQNAQRLLKPLLVANPYAEELQFADHATRTRRDHMKYLTLIRTIALLHQHQRPLKHVQHEGRRLSYIEVTRDDIAVADRLAAQVLVRSLDELPPQTRALLGHIDRLVHEEAKAQGLDPSDVRFTQRQLRHYAAWSSTQVKVQLRRLVELEYVALHYQGHRQRHFYTLLVHAEEAPGSPLRYDGNRSGTGPDRNGPVLSSDDGALGQPVRVNGHASRVALKSASNTEMAAPSAG